MLLLECIVYVGSVNSFCFTHFLFFMVLVQTDTREVARLQGGHDPANEKLFSENLPRLLEDFLVTLFPRPSPGLYVYPL